MKTKLFLGLFLLLIGCAPVRPDPDGWTEKTVETKYLSFQVWEKNIQEAQPIRIYIEGDGDPTPDRPIALGFAERDPSSNVIYLSRPCQYVWCTECKNPAIWREERFNEEIVDEMARVIRHFQKKYRTTEVDLIGYDGGGTMALLLASKVPVRKIITIGGILDIQGYAEQHKIKLNGMQFEDVKKVLSLIPQVHYVGGKDADTPRRAAERLVGRLNNPKSAVVKIVPGATHTDWDDLVVE